MFIIPYAIRSGIQRPLFSSSKHGERLSGNVACQVDIYQTQSTRSPIHFSGPPTLPTSRDDLSLRLQSHFDNLKKIISDGTQASIQEELKQVQELLQQLSSQHTDNIPDFNSLLSNLHTVKERVTKLQNKSALPQQIKQTCDVRLKNYDAMENELVDFIHAPLPESVSEMSVLALPQTTDTFEQWYSDTRRIAILLGEAVKEAGLQDVQAQLDAFKTQLSRIRSASYHDREIDVEWEKKLNLLLQQSVLRLRAGYNEFQQFAFPLQQRLKGKCCFDTHKKIASALSSFIDTHSQLSRPAKPITLDDEDYQKLPFGLRKDPVVHRLIFGPTATSQEQSSSSVGQAADQGQSGEENVSPIEQELFRMEQEQARKTKQAQSKKRKKAQKKLKAEKLLKARERFDKKFPPRTLSRRESISALPQTKDHRAVDVGRKRYVGLPASWKPRFVSTPLTAAHLNTSFYQNAEGDSRWKKWRDYLLPKNHRRRIKKAILADNPRQLSQLQRKKYFSPNEKIESSMTIREIAHLRQKTKTAAWALKRGGKSAWELWSDIPNSRFSQQFDLETSQISKEKQLKAQLDALDRETNRLPESIKEKLREQYTQELQNETAR